MLKPGKNFDINSFVDDCFQFVSEHDPHGPAVNGRKVKKVRGAERNDNKLVNLQTMLNDKKQRVMKNVLAARAVENKIVQIEKVEHVMRSRVMATEEINRIASIKKVGAPLQCGRLLCFNDNSLHLIESSAGMQRGIGTLVQKSLNKFDDTQVTNLLKALPMDANTEITMEWFQRVVKASSDAVLNERDAFLLFQNGCRVLTTYIECGRVSSFNSMALWNLLREMLRKQLLLAYLSRELATGDNFLSAPPPFMFESKRTKSLAAIQASTAPKPNSGGAIAGGITGGLIQSQQLLLISSSTDDADDRSLPLPVVKPGPNRSGGKKMLGITKKHLYKTTGSKSYSATILSKSLTHTVAAELSTEFQECEKAKKRISKGITSQMSAVTQEIALANSFSSAKIFAVQLGARKMQTVVIINQIIRKKKEVLEKWRSYVKFCDNQVQAVKFLKAMSTFRISNAIQSSIDAKMKRGLDRFVECKEWFSSMEKYAAVYEIQRYWRGGLGRTAVRRLRSGLVVTQICKLFRGFLARKNFKILVYENKKHKTATILARWWNKLKLTRLMRKIRAGMRQKKYVAILQRVYRGHRARCWVVATRLLQRQKRGVLKIQCLFRWNQAIRKVMQVREQKLIEQAALMISKWVRILIARRRMAVLRERHGCAAIIQYAHFSSVARHVVNLRRRARAALMFQSLVRGHLGRRKYNQVNFVRRHFDNIKINALDKICPIVLGYNVRRIIGPKLREIHRIRHCGATTLQQFMDAYIRGRFARRLVKKMRARRDAEIARKNEQVRIAAMREKAAQDLQRVFRGMLGRHLFKARVKEWQMSHTRYHLKESIYHRLRELYEADQEAFHHPYCATIQSRWRGYKARIRVYQVRRMVNARKLQRTWHRYVAIRDSQKLLMELRNYHKRRWEASIPIQCMIRVFNAKMVLRRHHMQVLILWYLREIKKQGMTGRALTNFRLRKREEARRQRSALIIQKTYRGMIGRRGFKKRYKALARRRAILDKNKHIRGAIKLQALMRKVLAKNVVMKRRVIMMEQEKEKALIAAIDEKLDDMHEDWMNDLMAIRAQSGVRFKLAHNKAARQAVIRQKENAEKEEKKMHVMSTRLQALVRGVIGRIRHKKNLQYLKRELQVRKYCVECESKMATKRCVQCKDRYCEECYDRIHAKGFRRGHNWELLVKVQLRGQTPGTRPATSLIWEEHYDEAAKSKYWFNKTTGEATWVNPF